MHRSSNFFPTRQPACVAIALIITSICFAQPKQEFVQTDIPNFWNAYDMITQAADSATRRQILDQHYLSKGSIGLRDLIAARSYTPEQFIHAITGYPSFWRSRPQLNNISSLYPAIEADFAKLRTFYPPLKPVTVYFAIGAFRTNGTITQDRILIGSELALADSTTIISELPAWRQPFYTDYSPRKNIALLCTHEYVHTQQKPFLENLLSMCLYEGIAEFVSCKATGKPSNSPAISYGKRNEKPVTDLFVKDLFLMSNNYHWLWGENPNELKMRDLGYYIGYEIAERFYNKTTDKIAAAKALIELDYSDEKAVAKLVDDSRLLPRPLQTLETAYEKERPRVVRIRRAVADNTSWKPGKAKITVFFSEALNGHNTGIDYGPLGEAHFPKLSGARVWAADRKSWTIEAELKPAMSYQILISNNFRRQDGVRLKPYLVEFTTAE